MKSKKVSLIFFLLLIYIVAQSSWWMYNLYRLSSELYTLEEMARKKWMIIGEGMVFLFLLSLGFILSIKTIKKELSLSQQQKNFLMAVTHELKTPIASVKLYLQTLQKRDLQKDKQGEIIRKSISDTNRLNQLVEDILMATKVEDQSFDLHKETFDLCELIRDSCFKIMESNTKTVHFEFFLEEELNIHHDKGVFESIVTNLVGNAAKYTEKDSTVTVTATGNSNAFKLEVKDEGAGIPQNEREQIFEKFYRVGNENTRKEKGTGLGLFITKYLVNICGGQIKVENNSPKGAIFVCKFENKNN